MINRFWVADSATSKCRGLFPGFYSVYGYYIGAKPEHIRRRERYIVIFGLIACNALKMLVEHAVDMGDSRNLVIFGGPAIAAIGMQSMGVSIPVGEYSVAALLGIVLNLVLPGRSSDAEAEEAPPVPREDYGDLACDFKRAENESEEKR